MKTVHNLGVTLSFTSQSSTDAVEHCSNGCGRDPQCLTGLRTNLNKQTNKQTVFMLFYFYSPSKKRRLQFGPPSAADVRPLEELISDVISLLFICPQGDLLMPTDILSSPDGF